MICHHLYLLALLLDGMVTNDLDRTLVNASTSVHQTYINPTSVFNANAFTPGCLPSRNAAHSVRSPYETMSKNP